MNEEFLALKPYLDSVKEICGRLPQERLTGILLGPAQAVPVRERRSCLQGIESLSENRSSGTWDEAILGRIDTPSALSEEQKHELEAFFQDAACLFLDGELRKAQTVYRRLFELPDGLHAVGEEHAFYVPHRLALHGP